MGNDFNLIMSSWPSAGGSTAARILALILNKKYIYAGGVMKAWVKAMGYDPKTNDINKWSEIYHDHWDYVWENYIKEKVRNSTNTIFEGKTAGFMLNSVPNVYKIYIIASLEARKQRSRSDLRLEEIDARDKFLAKQWEQLFGFDMFDIGQLKANYDYVLDTSDLPLEQVPGIILDRLLKENILTKPIPNLNHDLAIIFEQYKQTPDYLMTQLQSRKLIFEPTEIFKEIAISYPNLIVDLPLKMKIVFSTKQ